MDKLPTILLIEDDPIIGLDLEQLLIKNNFKVVGICSSGIKADDYLANKSPQFVILDIHLGNGPSGLEIAKLIETKYKIPYIFLTSFSDPETLEVAQKGQPAGYLVKPFQDHSLLTTIKIAWSNYLKMHENTLSLNLHQIELTDKEKAITEELIQGGSYNEMAKNLDISVNTLKFHLKNIYHKFDVNGRAALTHKLLS